MKCGLRLKSHPLRLLGPAAPAIEVMQAAAPELERLPLTEPRIPGWRTDAIVRISLGET